jgi:hypothetical protein
MDWSTPVAPAVAAAASSSDWFTPSAPAPVASSSSSTNGNRQGSLSVTNPYASQQQQQQQQTSSFMDSSNSLNYSSESLNYDFNAHTAPMQLHGAMDTTAGATSTTKKPHHFLAPTQAQVPVQQSYATASYGGGGSSSSGGGDTNNNDSNAMEYYQSESNEPPLLEELGIHVSQILAKTKAVILPFSRFGTTSDNNNLTANPNGQESHAHTTANPQSIAKDADLAGPLAFGLLLGGEMVLTGKLQFGYIYGFGVFGCIAMTIILNLMSPHDSISIWTVTSILGYALLPVNVLAAVKIIIVSLFDLQTLGRILGLLTVAWSTTASTRLLELGCGMREQRYLVAYPIALLYSAFVLITLF